MKCDNISAAAFPRRLTSKAVMAFEQTLKKDWYSILGADPSAPVSDLKQKYQKLVLLVSLFFFFFFFRLEIMAGKSFVLFLIVPKI